MREAWRDYRVMAALAIIAFMAIQLVVVALHLPQIVLGEGDSWLRLGFVEQLLRDRHWYDHTMRRLSPPLGMATPWTRPLDLLLIAAAAPFMLFVPLKTALMLAAAIVSPALMLISLLLLGGLYRRLGGAAGGLRVLLVVVLTAPLMLAYFAAGMADHHSLLATIDIAAIACLTRERRQVPLLLGALLGFGVWVGTEFLLPAAPIVAWLGLRWAAGRTSGCALRRVALAMTVLTMLGIAVEHPPSEWTHGNGDSVSIWHVALGLILFGIAVVLAAIEKKCIALRSRLMVLGLVALAASGIVAASMPALVQGPMAAVDPFMKTHFLPIVTEMQPLWRQGVLATLGLGLLLWIGGRSAMRRLVHERGSDAAWLIGFLLADALLFFAAILVHRRLIYYAVPPIALLAALAIGTWIAGRPWRESTRASVAILLACLPFIGTALDRKLPYPPPAPVLMAVDEVCDRELLTALYQGTLRPAGQEPPITIYASRDLGPAILFFTPDAVLAADYHRDALGFRAHYAFGEAGSDEQAHVLLTSHHIGLLALCRGWAVPGTYFDRLFHLPLPSWLHPVSSPDRRSLAVFTVDP